MSTSSAFTAALLPWGDVIEDFLDEINVTLDGFCEDMTGGWLFGYVEALQRTGIRPVVVCFSRQVNAPVRRTHIPTGSTICFLPAPECLSALRRSIRNPYGWTVEEMFGDVTAYRRWAYRLLRDLLPYVSTPPLLLTRELRRENCDVIICQEYEYARFDVCIAVGKLLGIPTFATFQGGTWHVSRLESLIRPLTLKMSAGLVIAAQTEIERVQVKYGIPSTKFARIFNPIDLNVWHAEDRSEVRDELGISDKACVAVWHGRVDIHRKGLDVLLEAWKRVSYGHRHSDLTLLLIGTGADEELLRDRVRGANLKNVRWINEYVTDRRRIRRYLSAADLYVLPSRHEGFPVAPVEAMACELPIVASDAPGVRDILEEGEPECGVIVPRDDAAALASAMDRLVDDGVFSRRLGENARRRAETDFSVDAVGARLYSFLTRTHK